MEAVIVIALVIFGLPIILSIIAMSKANGLEKDVAKLQWRLKQMEQGASINMSTAQQSPDVTRSPETEAVRAEAQKEAPVSTLKPSTSEGKTQTPSPWASKSAKQSRFEAKANTFKANTLKAKTAELQKPKTPKKSLEELIGAQWSVWVGGLALLVGAVFLLRYSIEAGVFTPAMRVAMAGVMGFVLLGAGEWLHRNDLKSIKLSQIKGLTDRLSENAYIPTWLTGIGLFTLFGTAYAAYALYGFIGDMPAFVLLGFISLGGLALSFRHGGVLAAIGLVGAMVVPLLVSSETPSVYALYGYLIVIAAAALFVAKTRDWGGLYVAVFIGLLFWSMMSLKAGQSLPTAYAWFAFLSVVFVINAVISNKSELSEPPKALKDYAFTPIISAVWSSLAAFLVLVVVDLAKELNAIYFMGLSFAALISASAWIFKRHVVYSLIGPVLAGAICAPIAADTRPFFEILCIIVAFSFSLIAFSVWRMGGADGDRPLTDRRLSKSSLWAMASVAYAVLMILALENRFDVETDRVLALALGGFAILFGALGVKRKASSNKIVSPARIYAVGSAVAYLYAVLIGLEGLAKSFGFILGIAIYAGAAWSFKTTTPRLLAPAFAVLSAGHSFAYPIALGQVSERYIFNSLWLYFALPCAICAGAAWALSRQKTDIASEVLKALTLTFGALFVVFQIRHIMNGGDVLAERLSFDELSLQVLTGLSFTLGATRLAPHKWASGTSFWGGDMQTRILPTLAMAVSSVTLIVFALGVCLAKSPLFNEMELVKGNIALNSLTLGYFLPALGLAFIAKELKSRRPENYIRILGGLALLSLILFVTGMIRFVFSGEMISVFEDFPTGFELYAISAVWLGLGIALLALGLKRKALDLRLASAVLITLTILKAFLIDMAELEGVLRALSFVVLGLILIVIGRSYQKILFSESKAHSM